MAGENNALKQFRIAGDMHQGADLPEGEMTYTLDSSNLDIEQMLSAVSTTMPRDLSSMYAEAWQSSLWGNNLSLRDLHNITQNFEPLTGSIKLPNDEQLTTEFFRHPMRRYVRGGRTESRSKSYYIAVDPEYIESTSKLEVIRNDVIDAVQALNQLDGVNHIEAFTERLAVIDYLKQHCLTLFHVLTYPERFGDQIDDSEYHFFRDISFQLAQNFTQAFYLTAIGRSVGQPVSNDILQQTLNLVDYMLRLERNYRQYTLQEIDHPLRILAHAHYAITHYPDTDIIVAIPAGGSQTAFCIQAGLKLTAGEKEYPIIDIPLSRHSAQMNYGKVFTEEQLAACIERYKHLIEGRTVLVTEDNSNSGITAQTIYEALIAAGAANVRIAFAEIDPHRIMYKQSVAREARPANVANYLHLDFKSAAGVLPVARHLRQDYQLRKMYVWKLFDSYKKGYES